MAKQNKYCKELNKWIKDSRRNDKNYISSVLHANFSSFSHNMLVEEEKFKKFFEEYPASLFEEFSCQEKVDLIDYWDNNEYGRTNKKR